MSSSESGEDFESADEDFDFDQPSKTKDDQNSSSCPIQAVSEPIHSLKEADSSLISQIEDLKSLQFVEPSTTHDSPVSDVKNSKKEPTSVCDSSITNVKGIESDEANVEIKTDLPKKDALDNKDEVNICDKIEHSSEIKPKQVTKKLCAKLAVKMKPTFTKPLDEEPAEKQQETVIKETKDPSETVIKAIKLVENENLQSKEIEPGVIHRSLPEQPKENVQPKEKLIEDSKTDEGWGDGWEIEEEDGFDIPVSKFIKTVDSGIKSSEEQREMEQSIKFPRPNEQEAESWGWGGWGVGSLLSTATGSVSTLSSQVTAGLSTVIGAPDPLELAAAAVKSEKEAAESANDAEEPSVPAGYGGFGSLVSGVGLLGSSVISRGLDTLETLGKRTMEVLQEGDPGLKRKRAMLFPSQDSPVLSKILREAKEKADHSDKEKEEKEIARRVHFESLFDDYQGMVHLEALEMLSTQCVLKLQSMLAGELGPVLQDLQETLSQVQELCELGDEEEDQQVLSPEEFAAKVSQCVRGLGVTISPAKIIQANNEVYSRLGSLCSGKAAASLVNQTAISSLAEFTAAAMECFHKSAELLLANAIRNTPDEAESYVELTGHLCARVSAMAGEFTQLLTKDSPIANSTLITNIFLEASNSCSYMRNACQLLVPILQVGAVSS